MNNKMILTYDKMDEAREQIEVPLATMRWNGKMLRLALDGYGNAIVTHGDECLCKTNQLNKAVRTFNDAQN